HVDPATVGRQRGSKQTDCRPIARGTVASHNGIEVIDRDGEIPAKLKGTLQSKVESRSDGPAPRTAVAVRPTDKPSGFASQRSGTGVVAMPGSGAGAHRT